MANLYNVPLKNAVQKTLAVTLTQAEVGTITLDSDVSTELQASATMKGILVVDRVDVNGNATPTKTEYIAFTGVSGSTVTGLTRGLAGTSAQGHNIGAIVEFVPDVTWAQAINDVFTLQHNNDGSHKQSAFASLSSLTLTGTTFSGGSLISTTIGLSNIDTFSFKNLNAPEGFLINGKIVPSVASNNLTVAIKTMNGNDATASNPIYVRIGDNIRTITGSLSVTVNAGTNWSNAGSSELATREVDYFTYIFYNSNTSALQIGFSRIPYATRRNDFDTSGADKDRSILTGAWTSDDNCYVIGRFTAILSAGASYNWSVPTFTATNLIQKPIYETRWLDWTTTTSGSGSMTVTLTGTRANHYKIQGDNCTVVGSWLATTAGTANTVINATLPIARTKTGAFMPLLGGADDGGPVVVNTLFENLSTNQIRFQKPTNWTLATDRSFFTNGSYPV